MIAGCGLRIADCGLKQATMDFVALLSTIPHPQSN
jgi:hypothetical protein